MVATTFQDIFGLNIRNISNTTHDIIFVTQILVDCVHFPYLLSLSRSRLRRRPYQTNQGRGQVVQVQAGSKCRQVQTNN